MLHASYDCIVVGAGIAGLFCAREILKANPTWRVAIAERYKGLGGRTYSYSPPGFEGVHWEMGAGRVRSDHKLVLDLLKDYGLHWVPIGTDVRYVGGPGQKVVPNQFESMMIPVYLAPLAHLSPKVLATHTISQLMQQVYGDAKTKEVLSHFPYKSEVAVMRADLALATFLGGGEMSSHAGYGIVKEGFSELVARLREDIEGRGGIILNRHRLVGLQGAEGKATDLTFTFGKKGEPNGEIKIRAERSCILALHKDAVAELAPFKDWATLRHLRTEPLLRCYAIFPTTWFKDLPRVVTPKAPRYILPMDYERGVIMISYTEGSDSKKYMEVQEEDGDKGLEKLVLADVRKLFPDRHIPKPLFFRSHPWTTGTTYWLPGEYDAATLSEESAHPLPSELPGVWLCGESWSMRQAWVEGALESAVSCLQKMKKHH